MGVLKFLLKLIILFAVIVLGIYAYDTYHSYEGTNRQSGAHTQVEQNIETSEDELSRTERLYRLFNIPGAVENAMNRRVASENRIKSSVIAPNAKRALVAIEDKRFYEHGAIDPFGIARAMYTNMVAGETVEGGSTITQQLVKNLFLSSKRIMSRKVEEAIIAMLMEHYYTKDEILTMYMNTIYYGHNFYGIKEASAGYFNTTPSRLTLAQSAMLAGLPQAPTYYDPLVNYKAAKNRQHMVLMQMELQGMISKAEADAAYDAPLGLESKNAISEDTNSTDTANQTKRGDRAAGYIGD